MLQFGYLFTAGLQTTKRLQLHRRQAELTKCKGLFLYLRKREIPSRCLQNLSILDISVKS